MKLYPPDSVVSLYATNSDFSGTWEEQDLKNCQSSNSFKVKIPTCLPQNLCSGAKTKCKCTLAQTVPVGTMFHTFHQHIRNSGKVQTKPSGEPDILIKQAFKSNWHLHSKYRKPREAEAKRQMLNHMSSAV